MSTIVKKVINGAEYIFYNESYGNRSGFVHKCELYRDNYNIGWNKCQYYNRTWECYTYQSVMKNLVYKLMEECKEAWKNAWKKDHDIKRLTKAKAEVMMEEFENDPPNNYAELKELYGML